MRPARWLLLLVFICLPLPVAAQDCPMLHYSVSDGLPSNTVYSVFRDSKGYMWFATDNGVARYNGIKMEVFTTDDGLGDNEIFYFIEDLEGRIWMPTYNGKLCYFKDEVFYTEKNDSSLRLPFKEPYVLELRAEADSSMIIFFNDRTKFAVLKNGRSKVYYLSALPLPMPAYLVEITRDAGAGYNLCYKTEVVSIDTSGRVTGRRKHRDGLFLNPVRDRIFNHYYAGNTIYSKQVEPVFSFARGLDTIVLLNVYRSGNDFVLGTDHGLFINNDRHYLHGLTITGVAQDKGGNYWVSTIKNGVYYLDRHFLSQGFFRPGINDEVKFSAFYNGAVFFSTAMGQLYRLKNGKTSCIYPGPKARNGSLHGRSSSFDIDENGRYHGFYSNTQVLITGLNEGRPKTLEQQNEHVHGIKAVYGVGDKVYVLMPGFLSWSRYSASGARLETRHVQDFSLNLWPFTLTRSSRNEIWYSTVNKVYKVVDGRAVPQRQFDGITFKWFNVSDDFLVGCSIENKLIICSRPDSGAVCVNVPGEQIVWGKACRLDKTHILLSTNKLYRVLTLLSSADTPQYSITIIENPIVPANAESICADGTNAYFFKGGTISVFPISDLLTRPPAPRIFFTRLRAGGKDMLLNRASVTLPYASARSVRLAFAPLTYSGSGLAYEYSVTQGGEDSWAGTTAQEIDLVNIGYGEYTIKLRARTMESSFSEIASLHLTIQRPFWAMWWFIVLCMLALAAAVYGAIRAAINKRDRRHLVKIGLLRSEYKAMNALMNPHLVFNVLNNVQGLIDGGDKKKAKEYLQTFSTLMRQNMHNISKEMIPLQKEIELLTSYLKIEKLRFREWLNYGLYVEEGIDTNDILIPPLLIQPLVENAILHGLLPVQSADAMVQISIMASGNDLTIQVSDNGIGINRSKETNGRLNASFGLENVRKRISQLSEIQNKKITFSIGEITDDQGNVRGTIAIIRMPI